MATKMTPAEISKKVDARLFKKRQKLEAKGIYLPSYIDRTVEGERQVIQGHEEDKATWKFMQDIAKEADVPRCGAGPHPGYDLRAVYRYPEQQAPYVVEFNERMMGTEENLKFFYNRSTVQVTFFDGFEGDGEVLKPMVVRFEEALKAHGLEFVTFISGGNGKPQILVDA